MDVPSLTIVIFFPLYLFPIVILSTLLFDAASNSTHILAFNFIKLAEYEKLKFSGKGPLFCSTVVVYGTTGLFWLLE